MLSNYYKFINEALKKKTKPTRKDLAVGKMVLTIGNVDNIDINYQLGNIIKMREYGAVLVEFIAKFDKRLHAGHEDIGKPGQCLYVPIENLQEIIPEDLATKITNKEVVKYSASKDLQRIFRRMKFEPTEEFLDVSFFDIDANNMEVITYLPSKKFDGDPFVKKGRQAMKVGRILKKLKPKLTDKELEEQVISYRAAFKIIVLGEGKNLDIVTGEDIRHWYLEDRYARSSGDEENSDLHNSCMRYDDCQCLFNMYCENPDKIALAVYTDENDKLLGRALVWKLDNGKVYMDRIYAVDYAIQKIMKDYAETNNMLSYYGRPGTMKVTLPKDYGGKHRPPNGNPYMDTFYFAIVDNNNKYYLSNHEPPCGDYKDCNDV